MHNERGLVGRAAITLMAIAVVVGLAAIDGGSVLLANLQISDTADAAATAGWESFNDAHNVKIAREAAVEAAKERDPSSRLTAFQVLRNGTVSVTVRKVAATMFLKRIGFLKHWAVTSSTATVAS
jgi:Flp pilus assembly protein TadG